MDFELNEDQKMLANLIANFAAKESPVERLRRLRDDEVGWEPAFWKSMAELGFLAVPFSEDSGGFGGGFVELASICESLGRTLVPEPYIASVIVAGMAIAEEGDEAQRAAFLAPMVAGESSLAFAHAERDNRFSDADVATVAARDGDGYVLKGEKVYVLNGHQAEHIVVTASSDSGLGLFVIDANMTGVEVRPIRMMDGHRGAHITLNDMRISADRALCGGGDASEAISRVLDYGAVATVAEGLGVCQQMLDMTVEYLKTREQFGVKIGAFQALQHRSVDMFVEMALLRSIAIKATGLVQGDDIDARQRAVSEAKIQLAAAGKFISRQAIQLHGGIGVTDEHDIGLFFKRMHALFTLFGDEEHHVRRLGDLTAVEV
jgi:alkylation response protein AidB-like acyl-CoA dehydrogenase